MSFGQNKVEKKMSYLELFSVSVNVLIAFISLGHSILYQGTQHILRLLVILSMTTIALYFIILLGIGIFT